MHKWNRRNPVGHLREISRVLSQCSVFQKRCCRFLTVTGGNTLGVFLDSPLSFTPCFQSFCKIYLWDLLWPLFTLSTLLLQPEPLLLPPCCSPHSGQNIFLKWKVALMIPSPLFWSPYSHHFLCIDFLLILFMATLVACGSSWARGPFGSASVTYASACGNA